MSKPATSAFAQWHFLSLTLLLCGWLLLAPLLATDWRVQILLEAFMLVSVLVTVWANPHRNKLRNTLVLLWLASVAGTLLSILTTEHSAWRWSRTLELLTLVPLMAILVGGMLAFVGRQRTLTVDSIFATIAAYLLLGVLFAQIYVWMITWYPASFSAPVDVATRPLHLLQADMIYFSLVTLTTVGYGDIMPLTPTARTMAAFEAVVGQFYLAVVVAMFVGMYSRQRRAPA